MKRVVSSLAVAVLAFPVLCLAQTAQTSGQSPQANNSSGNSRNTGPSAWITAARARHQAFIQARVNNPREGKPAGTIDGLNVETGGALSSSDGLSGLLSLLGQLGSAGSLSGLSGSLGSLTSLLGGQTSGGTTGGSSSGMTIADLLRLRDQLQGQQTQTSGKSITSAPINDTPTSGAIARLPKIEGQAQTTTTQTTVTTTQDRKFLDRLGERMAATVFNALAVGFQTPQFITFLKDQLRTVFFPEDEENGSGNGSGGGIEDRNPPGGGGGGSIV